MWALGQKAAKYNRLPSSFFPWLVDDWLIYCFDNAILYFCTVIEGALSETKTTGIAPDIEYEPKYTIDQLLDNDYRMERPPTAKEKRLRGGLRAMVMANPSAVGMWKEAPADKG